MASKNDKVNLDALIPREDLVSQKAAPTGTGGIPITELAVGKFYYHLLRKPHFQRETDDWSIDHVVTLLKSYRDGHLIPSVILWKAEGSTFAIDGAHRLSALIAWVNDDYGDGQLSAAFFKNQIPKRQLKIAEECRKRVAAEVGPYSLISQLNAIPSRTDDQLKWLSNIAKGIETQWVIGDADMAATSFLAINQRAVQIDQVERYMIENRNAPNVIAARAIVKSAKGHAYWSKFDSENIETIEKSAKSIYRSIFEPEDAEPQTNIDLQPAGIAHTANGLRIALDLVNLLNEVKAQSSLEADLNGNRTARFIEKTSGVIKYVAGSSPASLSLHPAVYFWGSTGNHRPTIFLAMVSIVHEMILNDELIKFTLIRARLEEFLVQNSGIGKHILGQHGGWKKSFTPVKRMLRTIIDGLSSQKTDKEIEDLLQASSKSTSAEFEMQTVEKAWKETKANLRHKASLESAPRCSICKARLVITDASDDHKDRRADGGSNNSDNAQLTHRYCNHGFKEHFAQRKEPIPEIASPV